VPPVTATPDPCRASFRPLAAADLPLLDRWLIRPHVARWWNPPGDIQAQFLPRIEGTEPTHCLIGSWDGTPSGMFQHYMWAEEATGWAARVGARPGEAGLDYFLGAVEQTGHGLGTAMLSAFLDTVVLADPAVAAVRVDIDARNLPSRRVVEKLGFHVEPSCDFIDDGWLCKVYLRPR
jgi:RimJ/RimL family protein N-acetyltransferase